MAVRTTTRELHAAIRKDFKKLSEAGELRSKKIIKDLAKKYYKSEGTIENIVYST